MATNEHEQTTNDDLNDHAVERAIREPDETIEALKRTAEYIQREIARLTKAGIPEGFLKACKDAPSVLDALEDPDGPAAQPLFPGLMYAPDPMSVEDARVLVGPDVQIPPLPSRARLADEARVASQSGAVERLRNMSVSCTCGATFATTSAYFEHYDACLKSIGRAAFRQPNGARPRRLHRSLAELYGTSDADEILRRATEEHGNAGAGHLLLRQEVRRLTGERDALWQLLDNIDTLDDSCREDDHAFRHRARAEQKKRFGVHDPDDRVARAWQKVAYRQLLACREAAGISAHEDADLPKYVAHLRKDSEALTAAYQAAGISDLENLAAHIRTLRAERNADLGALSAERAVAARDGALKNALDAVAAALHPHWGDGRGHTYLANQLPDMIVALRKDRDGLLKDGERLTRDRDEMRMSRDSALETLATERLERSGTAIRERVVIEASGRTVAERRALVALASEVGALLAYMKDDSRTGASESMAPEARGRRSAYRYVRGRVQTAWDALPQPLQNEALQRFGGLP